MATPERKTTNSEKNRQETIEYRKSKIFFLGKAVKLVQGRPHGTQNDGYAGYYWEG